MTRHREDEVPFDRRGAALASVSAALAATGALLVLTGAATTEPPAPAEAGTALTLPAAAESPDQSFPTTSAAPEATGSAAGTTGGTGDAAMADGASVPGPSPHPAGPGDPATSGSGDSPGEAGSGVNPSPGSGSGHRDDGGDAGSGSGDSGSVGGDSDSGSSPGSPGSPGRPATSTPAPTAATSLPPAFTPGPTVTAPPPLLPPLLDPLLPPLLRPLVGPLLAPRLQGLSADEPAPTAPGTTSSPAAQDDSRIPAPLPRSKPVRLRIPAIGVDTAVMSLGLERDRTVEVPPLRSDAPAGWYRYLASPGEVGPAVLLGHVDTARDGAAVFYRLGRLVAGDRVEVTREDGRVATFAVTAVEKYRKDAFPTQAVYGELDRPGLRLVTCGGRFDRASGSYLDNVVVFGKYVAK